MMKFQPESPTWQVLSRYLQRERTEQLERLFETQDPREADVIRGHIQRIDDLLDLPTRLDDWAETQ